MFTVYSTDQDNKPYTFNAVDVESYQLARDMAKFMINLANFAGNTVTIDIYQGERLVFSDSNNC